MDKFGDRQPDEAGAEKDWAAIGKAAKEARRRLLEERPELKAYQEEIDRLLNQAGNAENRLAVLSFMVESKLRELQEQIQKIQHLA